MLFLHIFFLSLFCPDDQIVHEMKCFRLDKNSKVTVGIGGVGEISGQGGGKGEDEVLDPGFERFYRVAECSICR